MEATWPVYMIVASDELAPGREILGRAGNIYYTAQALSMSIPQLPFLPPCVHAFSMCMYIYIYIYIHIYIYIYMYMYVYIWQFLIGLMHQSPPGTPTLKINRID